jgi:DNA-binding Lrp family transcriptional regulator
MATAYVLINCEFGSEDEIQQELKRLPEVEEVSALYGAYDIIVKVTAETMDKLKEIISWNIRNVDKVKSTLTMIVIEKPFASRHSSFAQA